MQENPYLSLKSFQETGADRTCAARDCGREGAYRAPKGRREEDGHFWFCLEHVRAYNAAWDYFKGMSRHDIDHYRRQDAAWHRPTWKLGSRGPGAFQEPADPLGILAGMGLNAARRRYAPADPQPLEAADRRALHDLGLDETAGKDDIKQAYKRLVKRYHPDANGGDRSFEQRLARVAQAYRHLAKSWRP